MVPTNNTFCHQNTTQHIFFHQKLISKLYHQKFALAYFNCSDILVVFTCLLYFIRTACIIQSSFWHPPTSHGINQHMIPRQINVKLLQMLVPGLCMISFTVCVFLEWHKWMTMLTRPKFIIMFIISSHITLLCCAIHVKYRLGQNRWDNSPNISK